MSYIGQSPTTAAFVTDTFSGNGSTTAFTMSVAPATTSSMLVAVSGVVQDPSTYSIAGTTLTFSAAPPSGTGNVSVRYLGIPAAGVATTAYRTVTEFTATSGQTTFSTPSYTVGFIDVYRNGVRLGSGDFTATSGTSVVLASGATAGDLITTESFYVSSVLNAIPNTAGAVQASNLAAGAARANFGAGAVLQVVQSTKTTATSTTSTSFVDAGLSASITPTSSTNKILVLVSGIAYASGGGFTYTTLYRGTTTNLGQASGFVKATGGSSQPMPFNYLDSPATTSSVTYNVYIAGSGTTAYFGESGFVCSITLMEIAA